MQNVIYVFSHLYFNPYPHVCKLVGHRLLIKEIIDRRQSKTILKYSITYSAESQATKLASILSCSVQFLRQPPHDLLMRSFISRHLVLRKRLIAHALCLARPDFKIRLGHFPFAHTGKVFFIRPLMGFPNIVVVDFLFKTLCRSYFTAGLPALPRCRFVAVRVRCARSLQKPPATVCTALRDKTLLQALHQFDVNEIQQSVEVHLLDDLTLTLYFSPEMGTLLKEYCRYCETEALHYEGRTITDNDFLFRKHDLDEPMTPTTFTWKFKLILKKNDLPYNLNVHSLRHTNASLLIANGTDVATVSSLLGHAQVSTTLDIYTHAFDKNKKAASDKLHNALEI